MLVVLRVNAIELSYTQGELVDLGLGIANGEVDYGNIARWIQAHIIT
jgi:death-on-curing protein